MRTAILFCVCQIGLGATIASAQLPTSTALPGVTGQPTLAQMQNLWTLGAMQSMAGRRGVQTGVSNPLLNGYGPPQTGTPPTTQPTTPSTKKSGKHRTLEEIKAAVKAKDDARRAQKKNTKKTSPVSSIK